MPAQDKLAERRLRGLGPAYRLFYKSPIHLVRGEGVWVFDSDGNRYLDAYNNVPHVGHCHPKVVEALSNQAATLNVHTRYLHETVLKYSERLTATMPNPLTTTMFTCTGSEANDLALRVVEACTGNTGILVTRHAYHGNSSAVARISMSYKSYEGKGSQVETILAPDSYRLGANPAVFTRSVESALARLSSRGIKPAAIVMDSIFASDGIVIPQASAISEGVELVRAAGGLYIADEVQPGFGRTGNHMWAFEKFGVTPDIVTLGKPMGNGHPMACTIMRAELAQQFAESTRYFNTFGGNPVSCAVGMAVLDVIEAEGLQENARHQGEMLIQRLEQLADRHPIIGDVRGAGLFIGVELVTSRDSKEPAAAEAAHLVNRLKTLGVLIGATGPNGNVLKIRPPLCFAEEHADMVISQLDLALGELPLATHTPSAENIS